MREDERVVLLPEEQLCCVCRRCHHRRVNRICLCAARLLLSVVVGVNLGRCGCILALGRQGGI